MHFTIYISPRAWCDICMNLPPSVASCTLCLDHCNCTQYELWAPEASRELHMILTAIREAGSPFYGGTNPSSWKASLIQFCSCENWFLSVILNVKCPLWPPKHTHTNTIYTYKHIHTCIHTNIQYAHTRTLTDMHACTHIHTYMCTYTQTLHTCIHTNAQYTHTRIHMHTTHTHTLDTWYPNRKHGWQSWSRRQGSKGDSPAVFPVLRS